MTKEVRRGKVLSADRDYNSRNRRNQSQNFKSFVIAFPERLIKLWKEKWQLK